MSEEVELSVYVTGIGEVDAGICVHYHGELVDMIGCCWGLPVKDHGRVFCKECKQNGGTDTFGSYEEFYSNHFEVVITCAKQCVELGVATDGEGWAQPALDSYLIKESRFVCEVSRLEIEPLHGRDKKSRHKQAIHKMLSEAIEAFHV